VQSEIVGFALFLRSVGIQAVPGRSGLSWSHPGLISQAQ
jgi:hypothetical protein